MYIDYVKLRWFMENAWARKTYAEEVKHFENPQRDFDLMIALDKVVEELGLTDEKMDGSSVEHLAVEPEGEALVSFANAFDSCAKSYLSPVSYIAAILETCLYQGFERGVFVDQVARGLSVFPALIWEFDVRQGLIKEFSQRDVDVVVQRGEHFDADGSIEVKLTILSRGGSGDRTYRLWSYAPTTHGVFDMVRCLLGCRAQDELTAGIHVLCPFVPSDKEDVIAGWHLHSESYFAAVVDAVLAVDATACCGADCVSGGVAASYDDVVADPWSHLKRICAFEKRPSCSAVPARACA